MSDLAWSTYLLVATEPQGRSWLMLIGNLKRRQPPSTAAAAAPICRDGTITNSISGHKP